MLETTKATRRRLKEDDEGKFPWREIFTGAGADIGAGDNPLQFPNCRAFDQKDGNANFLSRYFEPESLSYLHSSNCWEHLLDPRAVFADWVKIVKGGGYIIATIPEAVLYGDMLWHSGKRFNYDHKGTFSLFLKGSPAPWHVFVPDFVKEMEQKHNVSCLLCRLVDTNYDYKIMFTKDQTFPVDGAECFIELVFLKGYPITELIAEIKQNAQNAALLTQVQG